jgi:glycine dehydrogenase subunit 1
MKQDQNIIYPYIPNSVPEVKAHMLREIGVQKIEDLYEDIPQRLRFTGELDLPKPFHSEYDLQRHVEGLLAKNKTCTELISFLGAGCYHHFVPSICDEVNQRGEFLTAYAGEPYDDHGRFQALFEYTSLMGELLNMDVVNVPTYDGFQATATALRMASRITGRAEVLLPANINPHKLSKIRDYLKPDIQIRSVGYHPRTGQMNLDTLQSLVSPETAAIFFENPSFLGLIEENGEQIADLAHQHGAVCVVGTDPISLGILKPPADYGADIACGDIQPLGIHMNFGGGQAGFIASRDEEKYVLQYPSRLFGITRTMVEGEYGFGDVAYERTSFARREEGNEWVGTAAALWGITAGVYLALMGPKGMQEVGEGILARTQYAQSKIGKIKGIQCPVFQSVHFKEFVVNFDLTPKTVGEINQGLLNQGIIGGKDLSEDFPQLGKSALFCVTETHTKDEIDRLINALNEVV